MKYGSTSLTLTLTARGTAFDTDTLDPSVNIIDQVRLTISTSLS